MALNAYARPVTDRAVTPVARLLVRMGATPNWLTTLGLLLTIVGAGVLLAGEQLAGVAVLALGAVLDAFDGAVARLRGSESRFGAFYDSVSDRAADAVLLGAAAWLVREDPLLFGVAVVALSGAQVTSYIRAKAESLGWTATVGIFERAERVIILLVAFALDLVPIALWVLAVGALVTITQRLRVVLDQAASR